MKDILSKFIDQEIYLQGSCARLLVKNKLLDVVKDETKYKVSPNFIHFSCTQEVVTIVTGLTLHAGRELYTVNRIFQFGGHRFLMKFNSRAILLITYRRH